MGVVSNRYSSRNNSNLADFDMKYEIAKMTKVARINKINVFRVNIQTRKSLDVLNQLPKVTNKVTPR